MVFNQCTKNRSHKKLKQIKKIMSLYSKWRRETRVIVSKNKTTASVSDLILSSGTEPEIKLQNQCLLDYKPV